MLGRKIYDPYSTEGECRETDGLGLLDIETTLEKVKTTCQVEAEIISERWGIGNERLKGYEIHMGRTTGDIGLFKIERLSTPYHPSPVTHHSSLVLDGSQRGNVWGTYIHGIFDNDRFRRNLINSLRLKKGLQPLEETIDYSKLRDDSLNRWAGIIRESIDMEFIEGLING